MAVTKRNAINSTYNKLLPVCAMGAPSATNDWTQTYGGTAPWSVAADGYVFWTRSNRYIDKVDPETGTILLTRDFGAGANLANQLCACDVAGVAHIYCTTAYNTGSALCRAIKTSDLTDYWTQAWQGCPAAGVLDNTFYAFETASGVLIVSTDTSPYYWRAIRDNGATATYLWTSTMATSGAKSALLGAAWIFGISSAGGAIRAVKAVDGGSQFVATQTGITSGSALVLNALKGFGICLINAGPPYKLRKFQLSDGTTPAGWPPDLQVTSSAQLYPTMDTEGLWYFADGTSVYCYDEFFNLVWTYTNAETVTGIWFDLERNLYVMSASYLRCVNGEDHSSVRWSVQVSASMSVVPVSDTRLVLHNATDCKGVAITPNPTHTFTDDFARANSASLGNSWTDDYFASDTGAHDYWSIVNNKARATGITGGPNAGALCGGMPLCRDIDVTMTFTNGTVGGTTNWCGPVFRGVDGLAFYYFFYRHDTGNWELRLYENAAGGVSVPFTLNFNKPVIALGGTVTLRVVVYRQMGYLWVNGQGPYEASIGFPGETQIGMFAAGIAPTGAEVTSFTAAGRSALKNNLKCVWRATEVAGAEYRGLGAAGMGGSVIQAADGRILTFWQSRYTPDGASTWRRYYAQSTSQDLSTFQSAAVIHTSGNVGNWYGDRVTAYHDRTTDHVYALFLCWGSGGHQTHFVKFTKAAGGGWTAGTPVQVGAAFSGANDNQGIARVPGTGRLWIAFPYGATSTMGMLYSDNEGANWTSITSPTTVRFSSGTPAALITWNSKILLIYKPAAGTTLCSRERDDTLADKNTWGGETTLWSGQTATEGWNHGVFLLSANHANATFILVCRTSDGNTRAKKYLEGTGWVAGDTILGANQLYYDRAYWDGERNRAVVYLTDGAQPVAEYDPATNAVTRVIFEVNGNQSLSPRYGAYTYSLVKRGKSGTGVVGVYVAQVQASSAIALRQLLALENIALLRPILDLPLESSGSPVTQYTFDLPLEIIQGVAGTSLVPADWAGVLHAGGNDFPIEVNRLMDRRHLLPLDAWGVFNAIYHEWLVEQYGIDAVEHLWQVLQAASVGDVPHSWTVVTEQGKEFPHLWRVVPPQIVVLNGRDIQFPYGTVEKTS